MSVPVAASIREAIPDAELWWAVEPRCEAVLETKTLVNRKALFDREGWKHRKPGPKLWRDQILAYRNLRKAHFDLGIDLQGHPKTALALRLARPTKRLAARPSDAIARFMNPTAVGDPHSMHSVEWNLEALSQLGGFSKTPRWLMPELVEERAFVKSSLLPNVPLVTITVSAGHVSKTYPLGWLEEVGKHMLALGKQVAFLGGPGDPKPTLSGVQDWVGKLSLSQTMAAVAESALHIAGDTGTGHISAAYGVPSVSLFGPTSPLEFRPYSEKSIVLREGSDPALVPVSSVVEAAEQQLGRYEQTIFD